MSHKALSLSGKQPVYVKQKTPFPWSKQVFYLQATASNMLILKMSFSQPHNTAAPVFPLCFHFCLNWQQVLELDFCCSLLQFPEQPTISSHSEKPCGTLIQRAQTVHKRCDQVETLPLLFPLMRGVCKTAIAFLHLSLLTGDLCIAWLCCSQVTQPVCHHLWW